TATRTLSLHDALPIWGPRRGRDIPRAALSARTPPVGPVATRPPFPAAPSATTGIGAGAAVAPVVALPAAGPGSPAPRRGVVPPRSEEHTSELQSRENL